jgi:hypothetical protein
MMRAARPHFAAAEMRHLPSSALRATKRLMHRTNFDKTNARFFKMRALALLRVRDATPARQMQSPPVETSIQTRILPSYPGLSASSERE